MSAQPPHAALLAGLQLAFFETYSPLNGVGLGALRGIRLDILATVLDRRLGPHCTQEGFPWPRALRMVEAGEREAICTIATPERRAYAEARPEPIVSVPTSFFERADNARLVARRADFMIETCSK